MKYYDSVINDLKLSNIFSLLKYIPFSYMWCLRFFADNPRTVLDIGCGDGGLMNAFGNRQWEIWGVDIHRGSLAKAKKTGMYKKLIRGDVVTICKRLAKERKRFDLVFCSQVIEHVARKEGQELLELSEKLAKNRIYFGTPRGYMSQPEEFLGKNPYQVHKSGWSQEDFEKRGYRVYGVGLKPIWSEKGFARGKNKLSMYIWTLVSFALSPLTFFIPKLGAGTMAVKIK